MIFSDNYQVHERYSLTSGDRLDDYSIMPWLFTPLVDSQYKPIIAVGVKNALNRIFQYEYPFSEVQPPHDEDKHLGAYSIDDQITSYTSMVMLKYTTLSQFWKDFKIKTASSEESELYARMDAVIMDEYRPNTAFVGADHNVYGDITGLRIQSKNYDVSSYNNPLLSKLVNYSYIVPNYVSGVLTFRSNEEVSVYSGFSYPTYITEVTKEEFHRDPTSIANPLNKRRWSNREFSGRHITGYKKWDLLTDDQIAVIDSLEPVYDDTKELNLQVEHIFKGTELVDVILHVVKYSNFVKLDETTTWILRFDEDGNRLN